MISTSMSHTPTSSAQNAGLPEKLALLKCFDV